MLSKLQAAIPVLTDDLHVDRWVKKIFTWKMNRKQTMDSILEQRESYRLNMKHLPSLDATLLSENGADIDLEVLNISAGGLCGRITPSVPLFQNQSLAIAFVLPLEEPIIMKITACLMEIESNDQPDSRILHIQFSEGLEELKKEKLHTFIVEKQLELIQRRREWQMA